MALVKCSECNYPVSNKTIKCIHCGYQPHGICKNCQYYKSLDYFYSGRCTATEKDFVKEGKSVCPALIKKTYLTIDFN